MTTAAIYIRVSTPGQAEDGLGLDAQREACGMIATRHGLDAADDRTVVEQASGEYLERDGLDRIRQMVRAKQVEALIVYDSDRLSRTEIGTVILLDECREHGVTIYTLGGPVDSTREGKLIAYVKGYAAALEKDKIRQRTMDGKRAFVRDRHVLPVGSGAGLYGYDYQPHIKANKQTGTPDVKQARTVNESEAAVARRMFGMALEGLGANTIARILNREGIATKTGAMWHPWTVKNLLRNPAYMGQTLYGREVTKLLARGKVERHKRDEAEVLTIEGFTPPIVDRATFERVQEHLARPRQSGRALKPYMLSGMLKCTCGVGMVGQAMQRGRWHYYRCRATANIAGQPRTCSTRNKRMAEVDARMWGAVVKAMDTDTLYQIVTLAEQAKNRGAPDVFSDDDAELDRLDAEQADVMLAMRSATDAAAMMKLSKRLESIEAAKRRAARTRKAKNVPQGASDDLGVSREGIEAFVGSMKSALRAADAEKRRKVMAMLGFEGIVGDDGYVEASIAIPIGSENIHHCTNMGMIPNPDIETRLIRVPLTVPSANEVAVG